jgi:hypothetical protein
MINQLLLVLATHISADPWCTALLNAIAAHIVGKRPDRFEPRGPQTPR